MNRKIFLICTFTALTEKTNEFHMCFTLMTVLYTVGLFSAELLELLCLCVHRDIKPDNILLDEHGKSQSSLLLHISYRNNVWWFPVFIFTEFRLNCTIGFILVNDDLIFVSCCNWGEFILLLCILVHHTHNNNFLRYIEISYTSYRSYLLYLPLVDISMISVHRGVSVARQRVFFIVSNESATFF